MMHRKFTPTTKDAERFWAFVDRSGGSDACWPWTGGRTVKGDDGYGVFHIWIRKGLWQNVVSSRAVWTIVNGPIPDGLFVLHACDYRPCCNPAHLFLGTKQDNADDMKNKGRQRKGVSTNRAKLNEAAVRDIRSRFANGKVSIAALAREYGISDRSMYDVVYRRSWRHV